ncbi:MAG TPA: sulfatase [Blastocatellia bacterium]|nr:sulfatase [Blastocatellia bacterium]HMZ22992.1 sulfatase [Blastocatellia bacterium]
MMKKLVQAGFCFLLVMLIASPNESALSQPARKPNVLFIVADDLRNELGAYGSPVAKTPNLDRLAKRGMRFDAAYCQYPVCNPSRTSLLTGLRPDTTRVVDNSTNFRTTLPDVVTLPQVFRENGYRTTSFGKIFHRGLTMEDLRTDMDDKASWDEVRYFQTTPLGFKGEGRNLTDGKLAWCNWRAAEGTDEDQPDGQIAREAINVLEQRAKDKQPFFLAVGLHKPHDPFIAPKKYFDLYPLERLKLWQAPKETLADPAAALPGGAFRDAFSKFTDKERLEFMRAYLAGVSFTDAQAGKVIDALDRLKLTENTIVIFFGDHGYHLGERGWWNKSTLFELSARAPLMVYAPQMKAKGKATARLVEFLDLYPTLMELTGLKAPHKLEGRSFVPLLDNPQLKWKAAAYTQMSRAGFSGYSVRTERWRYTEWGEGLQGAELYDHQTDPQEYRNLANNPKYNATVKQLKTLLRKKS